MRNKEIAKRIVELELQLRQPDITEDGKDKIFAEITKIAKSIETFEDLVEIDELATQELDKLLKSDRVDKN